MPNFARNIFLLSILLVLGCTTPQEDRRADEQAVLQLAFEDRSNFKMLAFADWHQIPETLVVLSEPKEWNAYLFKLDSLDEVRLADSLQRPTILRDEHHPYHHSYLFKHKKLDSLISAENKEYLYQQTLLKDTARLAFRAKGTRLVHDEKQVKSGFWIIATRPLFTKEGTIAVVDLEIHYREHSEQERNQTYFGWHQVIYQKQSSGKWIRVGESGNLFL